MSIYRLYTALGIKQLYNLLSTCYLTDTDCTVKKLVSITHKHRNHSYIVVQFRASVRRHADSTSSPTNANIRKEPFLSCSYSPDATTLSILSNSTGPSGRRSSWGRDNSARNHGTRGRDSCRASSSPTAAKHGRTWYSVTREVGVDVYSDSRVRSLRNCQSVPVAHHSQVAIRLAMICTREADNSRRCAPTSGNLELSALHLVYLLTSLRISLHQHT